MNRTVLAETGKITAEELKGFRKADDVCLRHSGGKATIEAWRRGGSRPLDAIGGCYLRLAVGAEFSQHGPDKVEDPAGSASCFASVSNYEDSAIRSALAFVRAGDRLRLLWVRDNNNKWTEEAGLHRDEVHLVVLRDLKGKTERYVFPLDDSTCPDNASRLFRRS
jgi:hypothetical protein